MRKRISVCLAGLVMMALASPMIATAGDVQYQELLSRIQSLESELSAQQYHFASYSKGGGCDDGGCDSGCDTGGCSSCSNDGCCGCRGTSLYAGYELTALRPYISDVNFGPGFGDDYGVGHRFVIGAEGSYGLGARLRYWMFNHGHGAIPPLGPGTINIDMDVVDLEATLYQRLCNWDLLVAGGVRYGRLGFSAGGPHSYFEGQGPTVALEAQREVGCRGLYLVGNFRSSLLIGEIHDPSNQLGFRFPAGGPVADPVDDEITVVLENQLGFGWTRSGSRADLDLRAVWETQFWMNDTLSDDFNGVGSNIAFSGLTVSATLRF